MIRKELENKYGKPLMDKVYRRGYLNGCTFSLDKEGNVDIPESDVLQAIRQLRGRKVSPLEWD